MRIRFTEQGSRFIGTMAPAADETAARKTLEAVAAEMPDATHHAYAIRVSSGLSLAERAGDDGEPAATAGAPMLQLLQGHNISDAVVIGTRYYGGVKLGIGGLTRAYRDCARLCLEKAALKKKEPLVCLCLQLSYEDLGSVNRLLQSMEGKIDNIYYTDDVEMQVLLPGRLKLDFTASFESATRGRGKIRLS